MIKVDDFKTYVASLKTRIATINRVKIVIRQDQLVQWIADLAYDEIILVAIIPSADSNAGSIDSIKEINSCMFFALKKIDKTDYSDDNDNEINDLQDAQDVMTAIKNLMAEDANNHVAPHFMHELDVNGMHTDPEYDFLGCNGWSLSFNIVSNGF